MAKPVSFVELSVQDKLIELLDAAVAANAVGAEGVAGGAPSGDTLATSLPLRFT
jgi:hypothetical protein